MKRLMLLIILFFAVNVFAGYYKVYFKNGGFVLLSKKPDFSKQKIVGYTLDGRKILFSKRMVDFEKTKKANAKVKVKKNKKTARVTKNKKSIYRIDKRTGKRTLIITDETIGRNTYKSKEPEKKNEELPPYFQWKNEKAEKEHPVREFDYEKYDEAMEEGKILNEDKGNVQEGDEEMGEAYWRNRFKNINNAIKKTEDKIKKIDSELNRLLTDKLVTDDNIYIMKINKQMNELREKKKKLEKKLKEYKKAKKDLIEEARRSGALPGWYRDLI